VMLYAATAHFGVSAIRAIKWNCAMLERNIEGRAMPHVIVWDIETVPDLKGFAAANDKLMP
jgi:hypothetical protein